MNFLSSATHIAVVAPLMAAGSYLGLLVLGRLLKRRVGVPLGLMYQLFSIAVALYLPSALFFPRFPLRTELGAAVVLLAAVFLIALTERYVWDLHFEQRRQTRIPKLLRDVVAALIFVVALLLVLAVGYEVRVPGLLAGSGIVAIIIGLAMQDLLGNVIAGIALQVGKPFKAGDWLLVDQQHLEVVEINWRSTRLRNNDDVHLDIPNKQIASQTIVNFHYPRRLHAMRIELGIEYSAPPNRVKDILARAAARAPGVLAEPLSKAFLKHFGDSSITYEVRFWIEDHSHYNEITDAVRTNIWYELHRHQIKMPFPMRTLQIERRPASSDHEARVAARAVLRQRSVFQCLDDPHVDALLEKARVSYYGRGEHLIEQSTDGGSMFVLLRGEASVRVAKDGQTTVVASLRDGDCFGEMSLLTGERPTASVVAISDCEVVEIAKPSVAGLLHTNPALLQRLSELMARRRMETEGILAAAVPKQTVIATEQEYAAGFMARLRSFFEL